MISDLQPPYYAVIFTSRKSRKLQGYQEMAERMQTLCEAQPGFLAMVHATTDEGESVTTCYWEDLASITGWKSNLEHQQAQSLGRSDWYQEYRVEVARIERAYYWQDG